MDRNCVKRPIDSIILARDNNFYEQFLTWSDFGGKISSDWRGISNSQSAPLWDVGADVHSVTRLKIAVLPNEWEAKPEATAIRLVVRFKHAVGELILPGSLADREARRF